MASYFRAYEEVLQCVRWYIINTGQCLEWLQILLKGKGMNIYQGPHIILYSMVSYLIIIPSSIIVLYNEKKMPKSHS